MDEDAGTPVAFQLKEWLEYNLSKFLTQLPFEVEADRWEMPVVEDFVLVVAAKDYKDGGVGVFTLSHPDSSDYRIKGLLATALH